MIDLISFLRDEYVKESGGHHPDDHDASVNYFVRFCHKYLKKNPPVLMRYLDNGLGVQLMSGDLLSFVSDNALHNKMEDHAVHVIQAPGITREIPGSTAPSVSVPITGEH